MVKSLMWVGWCPGISHVFCWYSYHMSLESHHCWFNPPELDQWHGCIGSISREISWKSTSTSDFVGYIISHYHVYIYIYIHLGSWYPLFPHACFWNPVRFTLWLCHIAKRKIAPLKKVRWIKSYLEIILQGSWLPVRKLFNQRLHRHIINFWDPQLPFPMGKSHG